MKKPRRGIQKPHIEDHAIDSDTVFYYIAGYTCGGAPYGVTWEEFTAQEQRESKKNTVESRLAFVSGVFKEDGVIKFIIERMNQRNDIDPKINIRKAVNDVIRYDEKFITNMDIDMQDYSNDDEIDYIIKKTGFKYELIELILWQKYIDEMNQGRWEYDVEPCIKCGSYNLRLREIEDVDFADKIRCEQCGYEMVIGENGLESFGTDKDWEDYLKDQLTFPFEAEVCDYQEGNYISQGDKLRVHGIEGEDDLYGIIVSVRKGRKKYSVSLVDLNPIDLNLQGKIAVAEYKGWFGNR